MPVKHEGEADVSKASGDVATGPQTAPVLGKGACVLITRDLWHGRKGANRGIIHTGLTSHVDFRFQVAGVSVVNAT
jgi:hypothetical protein